MAIYHFSFTVISRSQGRSSVAAAAYRSGERLHDERLDKTADFTRKQGVVYKEILTPENAPEWMKDRNQLWNAVETQEKRKDAQVAREFHLSLPKELTPEQNIALAREFVKQEFVDRGMVADLCIHNDKAKNGEEQPHAHVMLTLRKIEGNGFGPKERSWNDKENIRLWREHWAECANRHLALNGIDQRIDHRSLEDQGIDLQPQKRIGHNILSRIYEARVEEHQQIARENGEKILADPNIALNAVTRQQSTFTHHDLARFVNRHSVDDQQFQEVYEKVKTSEEVVYLGQDDQGRERFTTREMLELESKMLANAQEMERLGHQTHAKESTLNLSDEQKEALNYMTAAGDMKCVIGYAGTGKSYLLNEARETWERDGYSVKGATLSGIAAENLEGASGIESRTIASRTHYWDKGEHLTGRDILVVDEAGMIGSRQMTRILDEANNYGAKVVLIGDPQQLQAIEAGASFRAIAEQNGFVELTEVRRQHEDWQKEATKELANGKVDEAIERYDKHNHLHEFETRDTAKIAAVEMWNDARINHPEKTQIILAYTRKDVQELNEIARDYRKENNELGEDHTIQSERGERLLAENDRLYFLQNNRELGVKNGTLGTIEAIQGDRITVRLDPDDLQKQKGKEARQVTFDIKDYHHIDYGYAATVHKAQGVTVDRSYVLASKHLDSHASYVGMSRHRESVDLFYGKDEFASPKELVDTLGRDRSKDISLDYSAVAKEFADHRGIESETIVHEKAKEIPSPERSPYLETNTYREESLQEIKVSTEIDHDTRKSYRETQPEKEYNRLSHSADLAIKSYIQKQAQLHDLMQNKNANLSRNPQAARLYAQEAADLDKQLDSFARQVMKDPELKKEFSQFDHERSAPYHDRQPSVADQGGWNGMRERQQQNQLTHQDKEVVSRHIEGRVADQSRERQLQREQSRDQGRER